MEKQELFEQLKAAFETFEEEHEKTTKKSEQSARAALTAFKKNIAAYKKVSQEAQKAK